MRNRIASAFRDLPIRRKLRVLFILTTIFALVVAGMGIVFADSLMFYRYLQRDLATFVTIIGDNTTGALAFDDAKAATETLAALHARTHVEIACLYHLDGSVLARWRRPGFMGKCPVPQPDWVQFQSGVLVASRQISQAGLPLGSLVLQYDVDEIYERMELYGATVLLALLLSCTVTVVWSSRLRALISEPILRLAATARAVSERRDYTIRATRGSSDEIGTLADSLNQMMEGIQSRDTELQMALQEQRAAVQRLAQVNHDLKKSNADLARSNSDLERFAFVASHDLQEPLRMITAYSQLLVAEYFEPHRGHPPEYVDYIVGGTQRMRELLADLLAYTEIAGSAASPVEKVDLNRVLLKVQETLGITIVQSKAQITADRLPTILAHEGRMASLFQNLIGNAIKYRGTQSPQIHIAVNEDGGLYTFSVKDNGIGIQPEYQQKIFLAFQRLHGKDVPGTGIGLAICQRVVERYGGRIWVESEPNAGSIFRFTIPKSFDQAVSCGAGS